VEKVPVLKLVVLEHSQPVGRLVAMLIPLKFVITHHLVAAVEGRTVAEHPVRMVSLQVEPAVIAEL
jgi:hypothetical protein